MSEEFSRTELLLGKERMEKLKKSKVIIFGIGGVGGYVAEALARCGVGCLELVDSDKVSVTNINRQIIATHKTVGQYKVDAMKERIFDICPDIKVKERKVFFDKDTKDKFDFSEYDYVVDAIDTVSGKIEIILKAKEEKVPIISSMGAGNKMCPEMFEVSDIYKTSVCPLARVMRYELKKRGVKKLKVVYSKEKPIISQNKDDSLKRPVPASNAFVPSVAGLIIAGEVVKDLTGWK